MFVIYFIIYDIFNDILNSLPDTHSDIHRRSLRSPLEPHLQGPARGAHRHRYWCDALRLHPSVHHAQVLEGQAQLPQVRALLDFGHTTVGHEPMQGE